MYQDYNDLNPIVYPFRKKNPSISLLKEIHDVNNIALNLKEMHMISVEE